MKTCIQLLTLVLLLVSSQTGNTLTSAQFAKMCAHHPQPCDQHPIAQAYVGGALDLLATLQEQTPYLEKLYCAETQDVFVMADIIAFMQQYAEEHGDRNAMMALVMYFEKNGGCRARSQ